MDLCLSRHALVQRSNINSKKYVKFVQSKQKRHQNDVKWRLSGYFIVNFEQISRIFPVLPLLILPCGVSFFIQYRPTCKNFIIELFETDFSDFYIRKTFKKSTHYKYLPRGLNFSSIFAYRSAPVGSECYEWLVSSAALLAICFRLNHFFVEANAILWRFPLKIYQKYCWINVRYVPGKTESDSLGIGSAKLCKLFKEWCDMRREDLVNCHLLITNIKLEIHCFSQSWKVQLKEFK